ncbi:DUF4302 domain-containing protein [Pedobacter faecalis]|uniref:DUF4302 domain-containing protein n=1 Tax=Pedobacter faecalis TaxID=3041495 RepID=UPI00254B5C21|nr:DUF4302 domain-containing protein [Pedobacter sp. ELA7]
MKRIYLFLILAIGVIAGCKKDTDPIFADPDTRLAAALAEDQAKLLSAEHGWKATIYPWGGKGFSYYFKFTADGKVSMLSDFNSTSASTVQESTYRLKALQRPTLIFDTYNYLHLAADPDGSISGGTNATGLASDFEFAFTETVGDTLKFEGTYNGNLMSMVKLSAAEAQSLVNGGLKSMMDANAAYNTANRNPYITFSDGVKGALTIDAATKTLKMTYLNADNSIETQLARFAFNVNKLSLSNYIKYGDFSFNELLWDAESKSYNVMSGTTKVNVVNSPTPLTPLTLMFGYPNSFAYRKITIPAAGLPAGVTSGFTAVYNSMVSLFVASGRTISSTTFTLTSNNTLTVDVNYASSTPFVASATYTYTRVGDTFTLSAPVYSANWTTRAVQIAPLNNYMLSGPFKIDWVSSSNPAVTNPLGGFYRTADPSSFIYGFL